MKKTLSFILLGILTLSGSYIFAQTSNISIGSDVPMTTTNTVFSCIPQQTLAGAFYDKQLRRSSATVFGQDNYEFHYYNSTYVTVYNPYNALRTSSGDATVPHFQFRSQVLPITRPSGQGIYLTIQDAFMYLAANNPRTQMAGQFVHYINRGWTQTFAGNSSSYIYRIDNGQFLNSNPITYNSKANGITPFTTPLNVCHNFYIARCGDGIIDNKSKPGSTNTDGKQGINTTDGFIPWLNTGFVDEVCDDGVNNGQPGYCNTTCTGIVSVPDPVCESVTINPNPTSPGQATTIVCNASDATSYNISVSGPGNPLNYNLGNTVSYTPNLPGNYTVTCTVFGVQGSTPSTCQTQILTAVENRPVLDKKQHVTGIATDANITVQSGDIITYTITASNTGNTILTGIYLEDILPAYTTYINSSIAGLPGLVSNHTNNVVSSNVFALSPGQTVTWIITADINRGGGSFLNTAYIRHIDGRTLAQDSVLALGVGPALTLDKSIVNQQVYYLPGDSITYSIVFSNLGNGTAFDVNIQDILPQAVNYVSSSITPNVGVFSQTTQGGSQVVSYSGFSLNPGQTVTLIVTGTVNTAIYNNTLNTAILQSSNHPTLTDTADFASKPIPQIQKYQRVMGLFTQNQIVVSIGDIITYQVVISNVGGTVATGVVLSDTLPLGINYISSSMDIAFTTGYANTINGQSIIRYEGMTLNPGQSAIMLITGQVQTTTSSSYINTATVEFFNPYQSANASVIAVRLPTASFIKTITSNQSVYRPGDVVSFSLTFVNNGPDSANDIRIQDIWPACLNFTHRTSNPQLTQISNSNPYGRSYPSLAAGQALTLNVHGTVKNDPNCTGTHINTGRVTYTVGGNQFTLEDTAQFTVVVPDPAQCQSLDALDGTSVFLTTSTSQGSLRFTCRTANNQAANLRITCGNGTSSNTIFGSSLTHTCNYRNTHIGQSLNVQCIVDDVASTVNSCQKTVSVNGGGFGICGNGIKEGYEQCDITNASFANGRTNNGRYIIGNWLDNGFTPAPSQYRGSYCENCAIKGGTTAYTPPACFYTNAPYSVQSGEILPFRWSLQKTNTNIIAGNTCTQANAIPIDTMECTFKFYAPNQLSPGSEVGSMKTKCFGTNNDLWNRSFFNFFKEKFPDTQTYAIGRYHWNVPSNLTKFGEYKVVLDSVQYQYCDANKNFIANPQIVDRVCEVNFAVTRPYLVQKSAFGNTPKSTTIDIDNFYAMNGQRIASQTDLASVMVLNASQYGVNANTNTMMNTFISKYKQLAVAVNDTSINALFGNASNIKVSKVPGQQIYIFESNGATRITLKEMGMFSKPFTMIVIGMDLVVQGSMTQTNGMFLVQSGRIAFQEPTSNACATRQTVHGVFMTNLGFGLNDNTLRVINNSFDKAWCNEGGLTIKGVLVGKDIDILVNQRRSHLNNRFFSTASTEAAKKAERRNYVFDGAAVLIEYNPALWQNLPPGMSEFTQILDVYKQ